MLRYQQSFKMGFNMEIIFGRWVTKKNIRENLNSLDVKWNSDEVINGHILLAGGSGTGKTYTLRRIVKSMMNTSKYPIRFHIFDVHDDIDFDGQSSDCLFSESSEFGLNPLEVDPDLNSGGVRKAIQNFISTINKTSTKLGARQESVLRALLEELYAANGFYVDQPSSWVSEGVLLRSKPKKSPTIDDLCRWTNSKFKQIYLGSSSSAVKHLNSVNKEAQAIYRICQQAKSSGGMNEYDTRQLDKSKDEAIVSYSNYINSIKTGREIGDHLRYDSKNILKSVLDRLENLRNCGVFKNTEPNFDHSNSLWRYRIKNLDLDDKKLFVLFRLRELYKKAIKTGLCNHIREVIVIDEANRFFDDDPDNILNILANEIRKFGVAIICASQSFTHFTEDFIAACACKVVLGIDEMYWEKQSRQLQIKKELLAWIKPQRTALIHLKRRPSGKDDLLANERWFPVQLAT